MHFPRHWALASVPATDAEGNRITRQVWGWSDVSVDDARRVGAERAGRMSAAAGRVRCNYGYPDRPLREPVLRALADGSAGVQAVITRNSYGCEVLNTDRLVFIDVDVPPPPEPGPFARLFRRGESADDALVRIVTEKVARLEDWQRAHAAFAFRVYRTAAGLRYALTSTPLEADHPLVDELMAATGADPDYRRLCRVQKSFRARLTPKHWRCGVGQPPHPIPYANASQSAAMDKWLLAYQRASAGHAVCLHLIDIGTAPAAPAIAPVLAEHDSRSGVSSSLPLA